MAGAGMLASVPLPIVAGVELVGNGVLVQFVGLEMPWTQYLLSVSERDFCCHDFCRNLRETQI